MIPVSDKNAKDSLISNHFGHCVGFYIYSTNTDGLEYIDNNFSHSDPQKTFVDQILGLNFDRVCSLGMGQKAIELFCEAGVPVVTADFKTVEDISKNLANLKRLDRNCGH